MLNIKIVKYLPSWLPGLGFIEQAATSRRLAKEVWDQPFEYTKNEVVRVSKGFLLVVVWFISVFSRLPEMRRNPWWLIS